MTAGREDDKSAVYASRLRALSCGWIVAGCVCAWAGWNFWHWNTPAVVADPPLAFVLWMQFAACWFACTALDCLRRAVSRLVSAHLLDKE